jgi:tetratricopeptide (TPR) repeat protein
MTYKRLNQADEAMAAYRATLAKYPDSPLADKARIRIGYIYEDAHQYPEAIQAYQELAARGSGDLSAEAQYLVGDCHLEQKRVGEAIAAYELVVDRFAGQPAWVATALARLGELYESTGQPSKARLAYQRIVDMGGDPSWTASAKQRLGLLSQRLGPAPAASPTVRKAQAKKAVAKPHGKAHHKPKPKAKKKAAPQDQGVQP